MDEKDGDVSDSLLVEKIGDRGRRIVTYVARDSANNMGRLRGFTVAGGL